MGVLGGMAKGDEFTLSGADPEGLFPAILGHEGAGVGCCRSNGVKINRRVRMRTGVKDL